MVFLNYISSIFYSAQELLASFFHTLRLLPTPETTDAVIYASLGGILPALFWLWFWTREDKINPEPRGRVGLAFIGGMLAALLAYPLESLVVKMLGIDGNSIGAQIQTFAPIAIITIVLWAVIEELLKYGSAHFTALRSEDFNEPIDGLEYLITAALGFAALENFIFILNQLMAGDILGSIATGHMRFIGASLLHIVSSAAIGACIAREFYKTKTAQVLWRIGGVILAITLHSLFNFFIMYENGSNTFIVFSSVWFMVLFLLILFEKIKKIKK